MYVVQILIGQKTSEDKAPIFITHEFGGPYTTQERAEGAMSVLLQLGEPRQMRVYERKRGRQPGYSPTSLHGKNIAERLSRLEKALNHAA